MNEVMSYADAGFTLRSGPTWRDPFGSYAWLRDHAPVHRVGEEGSATDFYVLSRYDDVTAAATNAADFISGRGLTVTYGELEAIGMADNPPMVMLAPPEHLDFRKLVSRGFTPKQVREVEPTVREYVRTQLASIDTDDELNMVEHLFKPLPSMVVAHYLGVPESDRQQFDRWTESVVGANPGGDLAGAMVTAGQAVGEMLGYFSGLIEFRKKNPGDDTVSHLVAAGLADDPENPGGLLSILAFTFTMVAGGNDTTTGMLGGASALLSEYRDQRRELIDDPTLLPDAIEEFLRLTSPVQGLARCTSRDITIGDTTIPAGKKTLLLYASANRDERRWGHDAAALDIHRAPTQIMSFSKGNHHCLGAAAARMQARVALEELLAAYPDFEVDVDGIEYAAGNYVRRPTVVPMRMGARA
ncbi:cytochrome P450 [Gordonia alkaliphila]|uniref:cytochrome P450 n=1 Tax=Gordonia alkaliphila TaxID=1053547 RepID=UPI001FF19760|nr:cytochrome P450 [Gordonia alkaliphila]MCK0440657.1 cytochrome P450 [Gordonia alkaliphila]